MQQKLQQQHQQKQQHVYFITPGFLSVYSAKLGDLAAAASTFERSLSHAENCDDAAATVAIGKALAEIRGKLEAKAATPALAAPVTPAAEVTPTTTEEEETTTAGGEEEEGGGTAEEEEESPLQPGKDPRDPPLALAYELGHPGHLSLVSDTK